VASIRALLVDDEPLVRRGIRGFLADEPDVEVVGEARNGREALSLIAELGPDLVFLDVQMPELDGLGVVAALGERTPAIVFVTAFDAYALKAFDVHAVDYLLKPFDEARFRTALGRARERLARPAPLPREGDRVSGQLEALLHELRGRPAFLDRLMIRSGSRVVLVRTEEIDWIEAADNYVRVHAAGARHLLRETIRSLEARLDPRHFARIHRSAVVNLERVRELHALPSGDFTVLLRTGAQLTLSRSFREEFERRVGRGIYGRAGFEGRALPIESS
jgi:two-component system LytT family response regulator